MEYIIHILILIGVYGILAISLDLVIGFTGLLSIAHAAFFGMGAYTTAILMTQTGVGFFLSLVIGAIITAVGSLAIGGVLSKFRDDYYALGSLGFAVIVHSIFLNWQGVTRGPLGIPGVARPEVFGFALAENRWFLILVIVAAVLIYAAAQYLTKSQFGLALKAIRENEDTLQVFGFKTSKYKLAVFVIAAIMASIAGGIFASYISFIDPSSFVLFESIFIAAIIILGGLANSNGALLGAIILILLPELLRFVGFPSEVAAQMRQLVYGLLLILMMLYRPQGIVGEYKM